MSYLTMVLLIISILSLASAVHYKVKMQESEEDKRRRLEQWDQHCMEMSDGYEKTIHDLRLQLKEQEQPKEGPRLQTLKQKIEMARNVLVPAVRWKDGTSLEKVAHDEGILYALKWLEDNHHRVELSARHVRE